MRRCEVCRGELPASATKRARFCGSTCRNRANRAKTPPPKPAKKSASSTPPAPPPDDKPTPFEVATRVELEKVGAVESMLGLQVLAIARRMGHGVETGAAFATLSKEHTRVMAMITTHGGKSQDPVDDVRERREQKAREAAAAAASG